MHTTISGSQERQPCTLILKNEIYYFKRLCIICTLTFEIIFLKHYQQVLIILQIQWLKVHKFECDAYQSFGKNTAGY